MELSDFLGWAGRSISFFNAIILLWLGLTVLLNAEQRAWGTWIIGGSLLFGGLFFVAHSAIGEAGLGIVAAELEIGWRAAWVMFVSNPYAWSLAIAWYTGTLRAGRGRIWLLAFGLLGVAASALALSSSPLPISASFPVRPPGSGWDIGGLPFAIVAFPVYSVTCFSLALFMLNRPRTPERFMGDLARKRARPWLIAASLVLLGVSLTVGVMAAWFLNRSQGLEIPVAPEQTLVANTVFDLLTSALLAVATVLVGQAIVSYEVFTGKTLPRGGLFRHWRNSLILATGYGALVSASLELPVRPIYHLLLATVLMTVFYALMGWRSYAEREESMERLRPFVTSQRLYERLLTPTAPLDVDASAPFQALCEDILGARVAYLASLGALAPLVGPPLAYPSGRALPRSTVAELVNQFGAPQTMCIRLNPARYGGADWAVPLWSERGLIGVLLLGEKRDGSLYVQEEMEIARAVGERLIDIQASAEMAKRLMALQRQRLMESQVLDRTTRRILHDDVLPRLHTALLTFGGTVGDAEKTREGLTLLAEAHRSIANLMQAIPTAAAPEVARLGLVDALRQVVQNEHCGAFDSVAWQVEPEAERLARSVPSLSAEVVFFAAREAIRNAARHGQGGDGARPLHLTVSASTNRGLLLSIEDDGVGLDAAGLALAGSGRGLALHSTMMAVIGGTLSAESASGAGTRVLLALPLETIAWLPGHLQDAD